MSNSINLQIPSATPESKVRPILFLSVMALLVAVATPALAQQPREDTCKKRVLQARKVIVCSVDTTRQSIRLLWKQSNGAPYGSLRGIDTAATAETGPMLFAMNAGMYHSDLSPVGLYIENGQRYSPANTANGPGNFHLKPNGVFHVSGSSAEVTETRRFLARSGKVQFATQSGPMLVLNGKLHPRITGQGLSSKIRNGVGVAGTRMVHFVISEEPVTFSEFARMFRDDLRTPNALYLDGSISSLYAPSVGRADGFLPVGPIVAGFGPGN